MDNFNIIIYKMDQVDNNLFLKYCAYQNSENRRSHLSPLYKIIVWLEQDRARFLVFCTYMYIGFTRWHGSMNDTPAVFN